MAIFGNLAQWSFVDVMNTVSKRSGKLELWNLPSGWYLELYLSDGSIQALFANAQATDLFSARQHLASLLENRQGEFELHNISSEALAQRQHFHLPIVQVLHMPCHDISKVADVLPEPSTRFVYSKKQQGHLDQELQDFDAHIAHLLRYGTDAHEVAKLLRLPLDVVCYHLYRLRLVGRIEPARAFEQANANKRPPGLINRLLSALHLQRS
jgi:hypothetical protein